MSASKKVKLVDASVKKIEKKRLLKCRFKGLLDKDNFRNKHALLTISIGQDNRNSSRLEAMLNLALSHFEHCTIALHDTLQRHTMAMQANGMSIDFYEKAKLLGDQWLSANQYLYDKHKDNITIIRWDDWLCSPNYLKYKDIIFTEFNNNSSYKKSMLSSISAYLDRYEKRVTNKELFNRLYAEKLCLDYLIEECAVLCLWPTTGCQYEIYDGNHNEAMKSTLKKFVNNDQNYSIDMLNIVFNHRPDLKPQELLHNRTHISCLEEVCV